MKKKQIAVLLAALLSVSPAVEGVAVMGADFSSGEEAVEAMQEQKISGHQGKKRMNLEPVKSLRWMHFPQKRTM